MSQRVLLQTQVQLAVQRWLQRNKRALREVLPPGDAASLDRITSKCIALGLQKGGSSPLLINYY